MHIQLYYIINNIRSYNSDLLKQQQQDKQLSFLHLRSTHINSCDKGHIKPNKMFCLTLTREARASTRYGECTQVGCSPWRTSSSPWRTRKRCSREFDIFHPKIHFKNFPRFNLSLKTCLIIIIHVQALKII